MVAHNVQMLSWLLLIQNIIFGCQTTLTLALQSNKSTPSKSAFISTKEQHFQKRQGVGRTKSLLLNPPSFIHKPSTTPTRLHLSSSSSSSQSPSSSSSPPSYSHTLAILTLPQTSRDRIANEAILETCVQHTSHKISIVLRACQDDSSKRNNRPKPKPKLNDLRGYVGEIYSLVWDSVLGLDQPHPANELLDVIVYPQNLPNAAPEQWLLNRPDLSCICSHDSIIGWTSSQYASSSSGSGFQYKDVEGSGMGGLESHVEAVNVQRGQKGMEGVVGLVVENWPEVCVVEEGTGDLVDGDVVFLEDEEEEEGGDNGAGSSTNTGRDTEGGLLGGGYRIPSNSLYNSVAVGGTFDGMHYGHRKLLTLAISSVLPQVGKLLIGITTDEMLVKKQYAELIPTLDERTRGVREFVDALAPGMKNRVRIIPIKDAYGPPGVPVGSNIYSGIENDFDALVLSHETLPTGKRLNEHRVENLGVGPLKLLCTRRTEVHGMSSTVLRKLRKQRTDLEESSV